VPAGKSADLQVVEERTLSETAIVNNITDEMIHFYQRQRAISAEVKAALQQIIEMKTRLGQVTANRQQLEAQIKTIGEEQNRIRQNMQQLDRNSDLYKRYVRMLGEQEDSNLRLRGEIEKLTLEEDQQRTNLDKHLMSLDLK
jgi:uncharacterized protein (DUF3084 family)